MERTRDYHTKWSQSDRVKKNGTNELFTKYNQIMGFQHKLMVTKVEKQTEEE